MGKWKFIQMIHVTWPVWHPCPYMVKTLKIFFSETKQPMTLKVDMRHQVPEYYHVCSNADPGLTLTVFMTGSTLFPNASAWVKAYTALNANVFPSSAYPQHSGERYRTSGPLVLTLCQAWFYFAPETIPRTCDLSNTILALVILVFTSMCTALDRV